MRNRTKLLQCDKVSKKPLANIVSCERLKAFLLRLRTRQDAFLLSFSLLSLLCNIVLEPEQLVKKNN